VFFCRRIRFCARHRYAIEGKNPEENRALFGEAHTPHEHIWTVTIWLRGPVDKETGMMVDLGRVDQVLQAEILDPFDGALFNEADPVFRQTQPTTEVLASYFAERLAPHFTSPCLMRLRVAESDDIFAEWQA
jgi:6-pyruvoyltetrahydropterin/6-carboxytetrahydropterin synthase